MKHFKYLTSVEHLLLIVFFSMNMFVCGADQPNVLFISIDDLNDYISPLDNHPGIKTPHFDRLAKRSVTLRTRIALHQLVIRRVLP